MNWRFVWVVVSDAERHLSVMPLGEMLAQNKTLYDHGKAGYFPLAFGPGHEEAREQKREILREIKEREGTDG